MAGLLKDIRGQDWILGKLVSACRNHHLPHALLFTGPSGVGRKKSAWALSQILLCPQAQKPCGKCPSCRRVAGQNTESVLLIEPQTLHIKIESIRSILKFVSLQSFAPARVIIIDSAHQMNVQAAGCLLKILEEPPGDVYFILISSHPSSLPVTIRSRTQMFRFSPLKKKDMPIHREDWMVQAAHGRMDQIQKWEENQSLRKKSFELLKAMLLNQPLAAFQDLGDLLKKREEALFVCLCWQQIFRDGRMSQVDPQNLIHSDQKEMTALLKNLPPSFLEECFVKTLQTEQDIKSYLDSKMLFDHLCLQIKHQVRKAG